MKHNTEQLLQRALEGMLSNDEQRQFEALLTEQPDLRATFERRKRMQDLVAQTRTDAFSPFFVDRLMRRLDPARAVVAERESLAQSLAWLFRRVALASVFIAIGLAGYNSFTHETEELSTLEAAFAMPVVTLEASVDELATPLP